MAMLVGRSSASQTQSTSWAAADEGGRRHAFASVLDDERRSREEWIWIRHPRERTVETSHPGVVLPSGFSFCSRR
jgi:hypothetical protein